MYPWSSDLKKTNSKNLQLKKKELVTFVECPLFIR